MKAVDPVWLVPSGLMALALGLILIACNQDDGGEFIIADDPDLRADAQAAVIVVDAMWPGVDHIEPLAGGIWVRWGSIEVCDAEGCGQFSYARYGTEIGIRPGAPDWVMEHEMKHTRLTQNGILSNEHPAVIAGQPMNWWRKHER